MYAETSAVLRWLFNEPRGEEILEMLRASAKVACSRLTLIESHRAVRRAARAEQSFPVEPVRTLDAIHLASALLLRHSVPDLVVVSTDEHIRTNASQLGFAIFPPR